MLGLLGELHFHGPLYTNDDLGPAGVLSYGHGDRCLSGTSHFRRGGMQHVLDGLVLPQSSPNCLAIGWTLRYDLVLDHETIRDNDFRDCHDLYWYVLSGLCAKLLGAYPLVGFWRVGSQDTTGSYCRAVSQVAAYQSREQSTRSSVERSALAHYYWCSLYLLDLALLGLQ